MTSSELHKFAKKVATLTPYWKFITSVKVGENADIKIKRITFSYNNKDSSLDADNVVVSFPGMSADRFTSV